MIPPRRLWWTFGQPKGQSLKRQDTPKHQVQCWLLLNVVIIQSPSILKLLSRKNEALLIWRNTEQWLRRKSDNEKPELTLPCPGFWFWHFQQYRTTPPQGWWSFQLASWRRFASLKKSFESWCCYRWTGGGNTCTAGSCGWVKGWSSHGVGYYSHCVESLDLWYQRSVSLHCEDWSEYHLWNHQGKAVSIPLSR